MSEQPSAAEAIRLEYRDRVRHVADEVLTDAFLTFTATMRERGLLDGASPSLRDILIDEWASTLARHGTHAREVLDHVRTVGVDSLFSELATSLGISEAKITAAGTDMIQDRQASLQADADADAAARVDPTQD